MIIDIDRVHACLEGKHDGERAAGHTTAMLINIMTMLEVEKNQNIIVVVKNMNIASHTIRMFLDMLKESVIHDHIDLVTFHHPRIDFINNNSVRFIPTTSLEYDLRGLKVTNYFIDNSVEDLTIEQLYFLNYRCYERKV